MKKLLVLAAMVLMLPSFVSAENNPKADEKAQVVVGNARFTVLTPQMIRMEWAEDGKFEDRASLTFVNRKLEVPSFKVRDSRSKVTITTSNVTLTYIKGAKFSAENLKAEILVAGKKVVWHYGDKDSLNLMGLPVLSMATMVMRIIQRTVVAEAIWRQVCSRVQVGAW